MTLPAALSMTGQQRQREHEAFDRRERELCATQPNEPRAADDIGWRRGDELAQMARGDVVGEERALVAVVARQVERTQCAIRERRQRGAARRCRRSGCARSRHSQHTSRRRRSVTWRSQCCASRSSPLHAGQERNRLRHQRACVCGAHGSITVGLDLACWLLTRRIAR